MNIVILGAGTVGKSLAEVLCGERHNVCLVDSNRTALEQVEERLDVQSVCGSGCDSAVLFQAGVLSADLCLAVTSHDEVNLVGASLAKSMGALRAVARVFQPSYLDTSTFDYRRHFGIDQLLSLEHLTALELAKEIRMPGLFTVENFARGGVEVHEVAVEEDSKASGKRVIDLALPAEVRIGVVSNQHQAVIAGANTLIEPNDHVTLIGQQDAVNDAEKQFRQKRPNRLNVVIAGGGEIGYNLARMLSADRYKVLLLESDVDRCEYLASSLPNTTVLHADTTSRAELEEARVGNYDVFVAAMGHDEDNIVCGVEARELGCPTIACVVRRPDYANVLERLGINAAVSPREVMTRQIQGMVSGGPILFRSDIANGDVEVWEVEIQSDTPITAAPLREIDFRGSLVAAIVRDDYVAVPGANDQLHAGDTAVLLVEKATAKETMQLVAG